MATIDWGFQRQTLNQFVGNDQKLATFKDGAWTLNMIPNEMQFSLECELTPQMQEAFNSIIHPEENMKENMKMDNAFVSSGLIRLSSLTPKKIIQNGPATIIYWMDGGRTVVKKKLGDRDDLYAAVAQAVTKRIFGSNSTYQKMIDRCYFDQNKKEVKKEKI